MASQDTLYENFNVAQSELQQSPVTLAAATTIAPITALTSITGTTVITTITPPISGYHELKFLFGTGTANQLGTGGNIATSVTTVTSRVITLHYDPTTALYYANAST